MTRNFLLFFFDLDFLRVSQRVLNCVLGICWGNYKWTLCFERVFQIRVLVLCWSHWSYLCIRRVARLDCLLLIAALNYISDLILAFIFLLLLLTFLHCLFLLVCCGLIFVILVVHDHIVSEIWLVGLFRTFNSSFEFQVYLILWRLIRKRSQVVVEETLVY